MIVRNESFTILIRFRHFAFTLGIVGIQGTYLELVRVVRNCHWRALERTSKIEPFAPITPYTNQTRA